MFIRCLQIKNYKSFFQTERITFSAGFTIIGGKNDVGKTTLIEALSSRFKNIPHRSLETIPYKGASHTQESKVEVQIELPQDELLRLLKDNIRDIYVPIPDGFDPDRTFAQFQRIFQDQTTIITVLFNNGEIETADFTNYHYRRGEPISILLKIDQNNQLTRESAGRHHADPSSWVAMRIANILRNRIYMFRAQRFSIGEHPFGDKKMLASDASNLPEVLSVLQATNPVLFRQLNQHLQEIFPHITQLTIVPYSGDKLQIRLWTQDPELARDDLAIPLDQSGTGISQVLAMLYVVLTSDYPQVILIDEPQSFLHPGAVRKLLRVLKEHRQHQYIITTHSPIAITTLEPETILFVQKQEAQSLIGDINVRETQTLRGYLAEIGARLSDVYGADNILWVEGATEERCFPLIVERIAKLRLRGTSILGVKNTGDLKGKHL